ncbi:MAG TPA: hypothetical protein VF422_00390, partial [Dokdonella sp.]
MVNSETGMDPLRVSGGACDRRSRLDPLPIPYSPFPIPGSSQPVIHAFARQHLLDVEQHATRLAE